METDRNIRSSFMYLPTPQVDLAKYRFGFSSSTIPLFVVVSSGACYIIAFMVSSFCPFL